MMPIQAISVNSSLLASISYEADSATLHLEFRDGAAYQYFRVPRAIYEGLLLATSKGAYFNRRIRGAFRYALLGSAA